jgi:YgiT-type zinc finger domain-containing protein
MEMEQELGERMRTWRRAHPQATMYEIEVELDAQIAVLRAEMLAATAVAGASREMGAGESAPVCPVCQGQLVKDGKRTRKLKTSGDQEVVLERVYMRCPQCGYGVFPPG